MSDNIETKDIRAYHFGEFRLDLIDETLWRNDRKLNINHRMFQVLLLLIERKGRIVPKEVFFQEVWSGSFVEDNNLTVAIAALRKALEDNAKQAKFIENLPRKGYRFVAQIEVEPVSTTNPTENKGPLETHGKITPGVKRRAFSYGAVAIVLLIFLLLAGFSFKAFWPTKPGMRKIDSVAVLPFSSKDPNDEYIAEGITDGISSALAKAPGLRVIDRNSTYYFKNIATDTVSAGRGLNVEGIVTGHIEQQSGALSVTVEIVDVTSNNKVWQQQFRLPQGEVLVVQQEIVRNIAQNLHRDAASGPDLTEPPTSDPEAYDLYIRGRYHWSKRANTDILRSAEVFQAAIAKDPNFAKAYMGLADAYALGDFRPMGISNEERTSLARSNVLKALAIDNTLGDGYATIAIGQCYSEWNFAASEQNYRRAVELSPNNAKTHHWYAEFLSMQGYVDISYNEYARALSLDPLSLPIRTDMALAYYYAKSPEVALELLERAKEMDPNYRLTYEFLSRVYREKGMYVESVDAIENRYNVERQSGEIGQDTYRYLTEYTAGLRKAAIKGGADGYWRAVVNSEFTRQKGPYELAIAYAKLNQNDEAFKFLEEAFRQHYSGMVWLKVDPELENLRQDPRYHDLLRRVGF